EEHHEPPFGKLGMVDQIRVDRILQVPPPVIRQQYVHGLAPGIAPVVRRGDGVVDGVDDVRVRGEEGVGFDFFEGEGNGFLAEGTADLFQGVELRGGLFLHEVDVGEAALEEKEKKSIGAAAVGVSWADLAE
ncbi:MAG: hypothetical protein Q9193_001075, partial [Seirophora villosa]